MSKAEDYITQNTKTLEEYGKEYFKWLTPDQARRAVEIARDEMMEKAIDAELYSDGMLIPLIGVNNKEKISDIKFGDKIKLIIIKDE